jgi:hypothetical protein
MALNLRTGDRPSSSLLAFCGEGRLKQLECLECRVGGRLLLVPTRDLERVADLVLGPPPPLAKTWVAGMALVAGTPVIAITLSGSRVYSQSGKGLLLRAPRTRALYAVIVEDVQTIWTIDDEAFSPARAQPWPCPAAWLAVGEHDGEPVCRLETDAVSASLFAADPSTVESVA